MNIQNVLAYTNIYQYIYIGIMTNIRKRQLHFSNDGVNITCISEMFEDTKRIIRSCISKNDRQYNGQKKKRPKDKQQYTKHYTDNNRSSKTYPGVKTGGELMYSGKVSSSCSMCGTRRVTLATNPMISHE